ncbi:HAD family hydrolase [Haloferax sp. AB510]|uniref:HAD family hydrolase n=1 Tax=Haloferax sp. AB510 TaxID=2934172 RepID=UPI00209C0C67|nr:HAD family hydrolase [Haloferax sp. AB510]MCO8265330.1 HAD family hydrolase [Haloferax sp. AB510]
MTTAVFFDLDLTLLRYTADFETIFDRAVPNAPKGAYDRYLSVFFDAFEDLAVDPYAVGFEVITDEFDIGDDPEALVARYAEAELAATTVPASAREALVRVADRRPTGILTNGAPAVQRAKLERHDLTDLVDAVVVSNDPAVASRKPDSGIFEAAETALPADDYVYVGDTYDEDVVGARNAGWEAYHVGDDGPGGDPTDDAPDDPAAVESVADAVVRILGEDGA